MQPWDGIRIDPTVFEAGSTNSMLSSQREADRADKGPAVHAGFRLSALRVSGAANTRGLSRSHRATPVVQV
jgi:hypothetical protein